MSLFEPSKWKVGRPTLRVGVMLSVVGAASYVIGACSARQPAPGPQTAVTPPEAEFCGDAGTPAAPDASLTFSPGDGGGFVPTFLCLQRTSKLGFINDSPRDITICFSSEEKPGRSPFADGETRVRVERRSNGRQFPHRQVKSPKGTYIFTLALPDGGCDWDDDTVDGGIYIGGMTGTLEVGTGGQGTPP